MDGLSGALSGGAPDVARLLAESERARADAESARAEADAARRAAESASRVKSEFLATMSHEFRTPLNAVLGYAQLLDMGVLGPATAAQRAHLERLQASARHLLRLVDDVLDVAKVEADRLDVRHEQLMTGAVVVAAVTLVQPQATAKGVRLVDLGAEGPGVPFVGDEHRVRQVLVNLLSNAVKFTPAGGEVTVICGAAEEPDPGVRRAEGPPSGWAFMRVEDSGPGIPPALLDRLFEPFVQGDAALTRAQGGTGLGLAISRRLARLMGGDVTARNRPDAGAVLTLWLRGGQRAPHSSAAAAALVPGIVRHTPPLGSASIGDSPHPPLDDAGYAVLHALGARLANAAETIAEWYVRAIRAEPRFPGARELLAVQIRDHVTPFVGLLASQLMTIGESRGQASELLTDGGEIQRVIAELHGAQRHRLGWSEADIERETPLLLGEVQRAIRGAFEPGLADGPSAVGQVGATSDQATRAAARYAVDVARHIFEQSTYTALRSYRFTKAADSR